MAERFANALDGDPIKNLLEKSTDDQPRGFLARQPARLGVEDQLFIDFAARGAVRAAHIVALDFQAGDGISASVGRKE